jgi:UDP-N-acetylmuramate dehydrogenase
MNLSGIEALSAIPGTAGATPVQNVGAYGQEIAETFVELDAIDTSIERGTTRRVRLNTQACGFSYRNSIFKNPERRHHIITAITVRLRKQRMKPPFYASLQHHLEQADETDYSPARIRQAVIAVRKLKLPDPRTIANCGSFFKNPIVPAALAGQLSARYPDMPKYPAGADRVKLAAGWLIEQAGLKGYANHGFATSPDNALVVVNESADTFASLELFAGEIIEKVRSRFGVMLEQEPETL